jgi:hypothetical protein
MTTPQISPQHFSAGSHVYGNTDPGDLVNVVRSWAQWMARGVMAGIGDLTDNSGGAVADGVVRYIPNVAPATTGAGIAATGQIIVAGGVPTADADTVTVNGAIFTFKAASGGPTEITIGATPTECATNIAAILNASVDPLVSVATYIPNAPGAGRVTVVHDAAGLAGNSFTLAETATNLTVSGAVLAGGADGRSVTDNALEAAASQVVDGLKEIFAQAELLRAKVPAFAAIVDSVTGTPADATIAAITVTFTPVAADMASAADAIILIDALKGRVAQAIVLVNALAVAGGKAPLVDNSGGVRPPLVAGVFPTTFAEVATGIPNATGADALTHAVVFVGDAQLTFTAFADAIAEMAAKLNELTAAFDGVMPVVAA